MDQVMHPQNGLYHVLQHGGVGVDGLALGRTTQVEGVVHVVVGGGEATRRQTTEDERFSI